jgi:hypothetical protein
MRPFCQGLAILVLPKIQCKVSKRISMYPEYGRAAKIGRHPNAGYMGMLFDFRIAAASCNPDS